MIFQWLLLGHPQFTDVAEASQALSEESGIGVFWVAVVLNIGLNLIDKGLSCGVSFFILYFIPQRIRDGVRDSGWKQRPLSEEERAEYMGKKEKGRISLNSRMSGLLLLATLSMAGILAFCGISLYVRTLKDEYTQNAQKAAAFAAEVVNGDRVGEYLSSGETIGTYDDAEYRNTEQLLRSIRESIAGMKYLYVYQIRADGCHVVFDVDDTVQDTKLNTLIPFDESFLPYVPALLAGEPMDVLENNDTYGFFLTAYEPIYNSAGDCVAYAGADASMSYMQDYFRDFSLRVILAFLGFLALILAYGLTTTGYHLIYPITSMAACTNDVIRDDADLHALDERVRRIRELDIHTRDEIDDLYGSICKMATDMAEQIRDIRLFSTGFAYLVDSDGNVVYHPSIARMPRHRCRTV